MTFLPSASKPVWFPAYPFRGAKSSVLVSTAILLGCHRVRSSETSQEPESCLAWEQGNCLYYAFTILHTSKYIYGPTDGLRGLWRLPNNLPQRQRSMEMPKTRLTKQKDGPGIGQAEIPYWTTRFTVAFITRLNGFQLLI